MTDPAQRAKSVKKLFPWNIPTDYSYQISTGSNKDNFKIDKLFFLSFIIDLNQYMNCIDLGSTRPSQTLFFNKIGLLAGPIQS